MKQPQLRMPDKKNKDVKDYFFRKLIINMVDSF